MAKSLDICIDKHWTTASKEEEAEKKLVLKSLEARSKKYVKDNGYDVEKANVLAVDRWKTELEKEQKSILTQAEKHGYVEAETAKETEKPEVKEGKPTPGRAWIEGQFRYFTQWRDVTKGKHKGKVEIVSRDRKHYLDKDQVKEWPIKGAETFLRANDPILDRIERRLELKYKGILSLNEDKDFTGDIYDTIDDHDLTPKQLDEHLSKAENKADEIENIKISIANNMGDVISTYRWESHEEGKSIEIYFDALLEIVSKHESTEGLRPTGMPDVRAKAEAGKGRTVAIPEGGRTDVGAKKQQLTLFRGEKPLSPKQLRNAAEATRYVYAFMKMAGAPQEVLDRIKVEAGAFIDLRGKNYEQSLDEWVRAGGDPNQLFGAATIYDTHALVQLGMNLMNLKDLELTAYHEWYHIAKRWVMTTQDAEAISKLFPGEEGRNGEAESFARFARTRRIEGIKGKDAALLHRLFMKLRRYLQIIANGLKGKGFTRPEDIFGKLYTGAYAPHFGGARGETALLMAGTRAEGRPSGLSNAIERLAKGENERDVWRETGWKLGPEGKYRWEIDDSKAAFKPNAIEKANETARNILKAKWPLTLGDLEDGSLPLSEILDHPVLFKHYPQLKDTRVAMNVHEGLPRNGSFDEATNLIKISAPNAEEALKTLFHEIMHNVQEIEGFSRGGSPQQFKPIKIADVEIKKLDKAISDLWENAPKGFKDTVRIINQEIVYKKGVPNRYDEKRFFDALDKVESEHKDLYREYTDLYAKRYYAERDKEYMGEISPEEQYAKLFGEIEARDTASRLGYDAEMRRLVMPYEGHGIPRDQWIVRDGTGAVTSFEVEAPESGGETFFRADENSESYLQNALKETSKPEHARFRALESMSRPFNDFMYWIVDKNRPIQSIQAKLENIGDEIDVFLKETQRPKRTAAQVKEEWDYRIKPMLKKMADLRISIPDLEEYSHAKHAHEANIALRHANAKRFLEDVLDVAKAKEAGKFKEDTKEDLYPQEFHERLMEAFKLFGNEEKVKSIKKQWDKFSERPSGMSDSEATEILKKYAGDKNIEKIRLMLADINNTKLQILYDAGLIPDEEYEAIKKKYEFYVPLHREGYDDTLFGSSRGLKPSGRPVKVRGGSTRDVVNIVGNSISNLEKAINFVEKARSMRSLKGLIDANPDTEVWQLKAEKKTPHFDSAGNIQMYPDMFSTGKNEFRFRVDGKQYLLEVNRDDRDAMLMLRTLKADDSMGGPIVNTLSKVNRFLARVNTSWSPEFVITNFARDLQTAGINIRDTDVKSKKLFSGALEAARAIYRVEREKTKGGELEALYGRFKKAGGKIGWSDVHGSVERLSKNLTKDLEVLEGKRPALKTARAWIKWIEDANTSIENGVRLHVFKLAIEQGKTDERAAQIASDLTVDFTKKGAAGPVINSLYLFANAGIQGSYRIMRAGAKSQRVRQIMAGIVGVGFLNGLLNSLVGGDDDDEEDYFNKIDDFVRERNAIFMIPGTKGNYVKFPLPWGYNFLWNVGNEMSRAFTKQNYDPLKGAARVAGIFANAFNPVASGTLLQTIAPTVLDPIAQVAENKNWFGGDLMPAKNIFEKAPTPDSQRYWGSARGMSVWITSQLNSLTGGDKIKQGSIDVSPETLDLIVDTVGGSALRFFTDIVDIPQKMLQEEKVAIHKYPFARRVYGEPSEWANSRTYKDNIEEVFVAKERLKTYRGTDFFKEVYNETKTMRSVFWAAESAEKTLRNLRERKKAAKAMKNRVAVKQAEESMEKVYIKFNKQYNEAIKRSKKAANE